MKGDIVIPRKTTDNNWSTFSIIAMLDAKIEAMEKKLQTHRDVREALRRILEEEQASALLPSSLPLLTAHDPKTAPVVGTVPPASVPEPVRGLSPADKGKWINKVLSELPPGWHSIKDIDGFLRKAGLFCTNPSQVVLRRWDAGLLTKRDDGPLFLYAVPSYAAGDGKNVKNGGDEKPIASALKESFAKAPENNPTPAEMRGIFQRPIQDVLDELKCDISVILPIGPSAIQIGRESFPGRFSLMDAQARLGPKYANAWLARWMQQGWIKTIAPMTYEKTDKFGL